MEQQDPPTSSHAHVHSEECRCNHVHEHNLMPLRTRWLVSLAIVGILFIFVRPFLIVTMYSRANAYALYGRHNDSVRIHKKLVLIDKGDPRALTALGFSYIDGGQPENAIAAFEKDIKINPRDKAAAFFELGEAYFVKSNFAQAVKYLQLAKSELPERSASSNEDIIKYHHNSSGFQNAYDMGSLLRMMWGCYNLWGNMDQAAEIQKEYMIYKSKNKKILF